MKKYNPVKTSQFTKDLNTCKTRKVNLLPVFQVVLKLANSEELPYNFRKHKLSGKYSGSFEGHVYNDILLVFSYQGDDIYFERLGTHSDLFR